MTETVGLPLNETTLATQLKKAGYATMAVGAARAHGRPCPVLPTMATPPVTHRRLSAPLASALRREVVTKTRRLDPHFPDASFDFVRIHYDFSGLIGNRGFF